MQLQQLKPLGARPEGNSEGPAGSGGPAAALMRGVYFCRVFSKGSPE